MSTSSSEDPVNQTNAPVTHGPIDPSSATSSQAALPVPRLVVVCSNCNATLSVRRAYVGKSVQCKQCSQIFTVPAEVDTQPMPVVDRNLADMPSPPPQADLDAGNQHSGAVEKVLRDQVAQLIAGNNDLRSAHDQLQAEHNELRADRDEIGARLESVTAELNAIRADLGTIAPTDVQLLASERADLSALVQVLRDGNRDLQSKQSNHEDLVNQLEKRVLELVPFRAERDALTERVNLHEGDLCAIRAERDALAGELSEHSSELVAVRAERDALSGNLSEHSSELVAARSELAQWSRRIEQSDRDLETACQAREQLSQQLEMFRNDLCLARADLDRSSGERQTALDTVEQLTTTLAERDLTIREVHDQWSVEVESNQQTLSLAERSHLAECEKLTAELAALRARHHQLEEERRSTEMLCKQLQDCNQELVTAQARLESESDALRNAARTERQELAAEILALRTNAEETARVAEQLISADLNPPMAPLTPPNELEAARVHAAELKFKLDQAERLYRAMAETLEGIGIRVDLPIPPRDRVQSER
jgi:chromosome segregation ATPase